MSVNHDQFSHFSRLRPGSSAVILQMVVVLAQIVILGASWPHISLEPRGQGRQVVHVVELCCYQGDRMDVNHDQFSHFSRFCPGSPAVILQMVVILAQIVSFVASGLNISLGPRGQCRQVVFAVELWR